MLISSVVKTNSALLATKIRSFLSAQFVELVVISEALAIGKLPEASEISPIAPILSSRKTVVSDKSVKENTAPAIEITSGQLRSPVTMATPPSSLEAKTLSVPVSGASGSKRTNGQSNSVSLIHSKGVSNHKT